MPTSKSKSSQNTVKFSANTQRLTNRNHFQSEQRAISPIRAELEARVTIQLEQKKGRRRVGLAPTWAGVMMALGVASWMLLEVLELIWTVLAK
jgi:hypothetical protein